MADDFLTRKVNKERRRPEYASYLLKSNVLPEIGERKVKEITTRQIIVTLEKISNRGAFVLANRTASIVKQMFNYAYQRGLRDDNPCAPLSKTTIGGRETPRTRFLTFEEIKRLWLAAEASKISPAMKIAAKLLLLTGQRRGELVLAEWAHVDLQANLWTIPSELSKNGKPHLVSISPPVKALFEQLHELANGSRYLFPSSRPHFDQPCDIRALNKALSKVTSAASIDGCSPHTLRHTFSTLASQMGIQLHVIEKVLNHSLGGMLAVYNHEDFLELRKRALAIWAEKVLEIVDPNSDRHSQSKVSGALLRETSSGTAPIHASGPIPAIHLVLQHPYKLEKMLPLPHGAES